MFLVLSAGEVIHVAEKPAERARQEYLLDVAVANECRIEKAGLIVTDDEDRQVFAAGFTFRRVGNGLFYQLRRRSAVFAVANAKRDEIWMCDGFATSNCVEHD